MHIVCDLGTSNFRAIAVGQDGLVSEPCVLARDRQNGLVIGEAAHLMVGRNSDWIEIVSPVEGGGVRNIEAAIEVIRYCINRLNPNRFMRKFTITLSIPWGLTQVEKRALEDAARFAGARRVDFLNASVAAALGSDLSVDSPTGCLVVNLGGGVTEVALLSMRGIVSCHSVRSGGQALNLAMAERVRKEFTFLMGIRTTEMLKRQLCENNDLPGLEVRGRDLVTGLPDQLFVPRSVVDEPMMSYCDTIVDLVSQVITECPPDLVGDIMENGVVLVGGGANCVTIVDQLTTRLDAPVLRVDNPDTRVIEGLLKAQGKTERRARLDVMGLLRLRPDSPVQGSGLS